MIELPEQDGWAVEMHGECVLFANNAEKASGRSPGAATPVYTAATVRRLIAEAVANEREACADEADHWIGFDKTASDACDEIAAAIRARTKGPRND